MFCQNEFWFHQNTGTFPQNQNPFRRIDFSLLQNIILI